MRHHVAGCAMTASSEPVSLLQLPGDVLVDVVQRCGSREKAALFATCHSARQLVIGCSQFVSATVKTKDLVCRKTLLTVLAGPLALRLEKATLSELCNARKQLAGVRHLELVFLQHCPSLLSKAMGRLFQAWRSDILHELQQALSGLHSLSILTAGTATDAPNLIAAIAPACTGLTRLELGTEGHSCKHLLPGHLRILDVLSSPSAFPALQQLHIRGLPYEAQELDRVLQHPVVQARVTSLGTPHLVDYLELTSLISLRRLTALQLSGFILCKESMLMMQHLTCLTHLSVELLSRPSPYQEGLQHCTFPAQLKLLCICNLLLYEVEGWLDALATVPLLKVTSLVVSSSSGAEGSLAEAQLAASRSAAEVLAAAGSLQAGMQSSHGCTGLRTRERVFPVYVRPTCLSPALQAQAYAAVQPLLSQVQCIGLSHSFFLDQWRQRCISALGSALRENVTHLSLCAPAPSYICQRSTWEILVAALPHVRVFQLTFQSFESEESLCPVVAPLLESAAHACERMGRALELCIPAGILSSKDYQRLISISPVINVVEVQEGLFA